MNPETEEKIYFYTEDLQVGYGGKQILNPVRIGIKKGEILTLVGPNGAGKTTCFNMRKAGYDVTVLSDCVTSYDKKQIDEMLQYYESKGSKVITVKELLN